MTGLSRNTYSKNDEVLLLSNTRVRKRRIQLKIRRWVAANRARQKTLAWLVIRTNELRNVTNVAADSFLLTHRYRLWLEQL